MTVLTVLNAVSEALHLLEPELRKRQIQVQWDISPHLPAAYAEPVALQQILHNLLLNAMQAMDSVAVVQRVLHIECTQQAQQLCLAVQDNAAGIAPGMRERLFVPFATTREQGLGLGLTLSESLAQAMGGALHSFMQRRIAIGAWLCDHCNVINMFSRPRLTSLWRSNDSYNIL